MNKNYTIVKIGYNRFCFENQMDALELYGLISKSIPIDSCYGELPGGRKGIDWIRDDSLSIGLEQADPKKCELVYTKEELKEQSEANADVDGGVTLIEITAAPLEIGHDLPF